MHANSFYSGNLSCATFRFQDCCICHAAIEIPITGRLPRKPGVRSCGSLGFARPTVVRFPSPPGKPLVCHQSSGGRHLLPAEIRAVLDSALRASHPACNRYRRVFEHCLHDSQPRSPCFRATYSATNPRPIFNHQFGRPAGRILRRPLDFGTHFRQPHQPLTRVDSTVRGGRSSNPPKISAPVNGQGLRGGWDPVVEPKRRPAAGDIRTR